MHRSKRKATNEDAGIRFRRAEKLAVSQSACPTSLESSNYLSVSLSAFSIVSLSVASACIDQLGALAPLDSNA